MSTMRKNTWALILAFLLLLAVCAIQTVTNHDETAKQPVHASLIPGSASQR